MSDDWRELLDRALEGEELDERELRLLAAALADEGARREARELLRFDAQLQGRLAAEPGRAAALSRERLLAKAALREKRLGLRGIPMPRRTAKAAVAAAAALLIAALGWLLLQGRGGYPAPQARGDFQVAVAEGEWARAPRVERGQRLAVGAGGAQLRLGGYCELSLDPNARVVVRGEARNEAVELERGRIVCRVRPRSGRFALLTPLGSIEVKGTEFITTVDYPEPQEGDADMGRVRKAVTVTVMVVSGAVAYHLADSVGLLSAGMSQAFAREDEPEPLALPDGLAGFKGILVGTIVGPVDREFLLKVEKIATVWPQSRADNPQAAVGRNVGIVVGRNRLTEQHIRTLKRLKTGDQIIVEAFHIEGKRLTVMELLRKAGDTPGEGDRKPERGKGEREGNGRAIKRDGGEREGEGRAIKRDGGEREGEGRAIKRDADGEREAEVRAEGGGMTGPDVVEGFRGMIEGTLVGKSPDAFVVRVDKINKVWRTNTAKSPEALVGKSVTVSLKQEPRPAEALLKALAELKAGDRIMVGVVHRAGSGLALVEVLRKLEAF